MAEEKICSRRQADLTGLFFHSPLEDNIRILRRATMPPEPVPSAEDIRNRARETPAHQECQASVSWEGHIVLETRDGKETGLSDESDTHALH